jgi:enamine deaminase RidA (YjgF/YER057c/UK114 family)
LRSDAKLSHASLLDQLPTPPRAQGGYVPATVHELPGTSGGLVMTAGMTPRVDGVLQHRGQVGADLDVASAQAAAAIAVRNALAAALAALGPDRRLDRVLRLSVYVNAAPDFEQHTAVADGASAWLRELLGEYGDAARAAVGVTSLPGGACVELELTCAWRADGD